MFLEHDSCGLSAGTQTTLATALEQSLQDLQVSLVLLTIVTVIIGKPLFLSYSHDIVS